MDFKKLSALQLNPKVIVIAAVVGLAAGLCIAHKPCKNTIVTIELHDRRMCDVY
jgi:hypothetical protein